MSTCVTRNGKAASASSRKATAEAVGLVVFDRQVHVAGGAVDGDVEIALTSFAIAVAQLGQVLHVHVHEADLVVLEGRCAAYACGQPAAAG